MSERHRALPSWMAKKEVKEKAPLKTRRKKKAARAVFYCMNEAELVEAAVSFISDETCEDVTVPAEQQVEKQTKETCEIKKKPGTAQIKTKLITETLEEETSDCCSDVETTYISETDLDVTELETLPYTKSKQHPESENEGSEAAQEHPKLINTNTVAGKQKQQFQPPEERGKEDDALQLLKDITKMFLKNRKQEKLKSEQREKATMEKHLKIERNMYNPLFASL